MPTDVRAGNTRLMARENNVVVSGEIVDSLWEEDFTSLDDQQKIDDLRERLKLLGLDPTAAEELVKKGKGEAMIKGAPAESFSVQPQRALEEARKRVAEQGNRLAKILLNHADLDINGREIPHKYTSLGLSGRTNFIAAVMMVNHEINGRLGKDRDQCSLEEFQMVLNSLDEIVQSLVRRLYSKLALRSIADAPRSLFSDIAVNELLTEWKKRQARRIEWKVKRASAVSKGS